MNEITLGSVIRTSSGIVGRVLRIVSKPGATFYRLERLIECPSGRLIETRQLAFVADSEVIAVRMTPQPANPRHATNLREWYQQMVAPCEATTEQVIASARDAFEVAMEPVESEYTLYA